METHDEAHGFSPLPRQFHWIDDAAGKDQAAVFELGKDIVRTTLKIMETRLGKDVQYQDEEARKSMGGGGK